ncbi:hypothetical protein HPB52_013612 [Rhipicephalus sanguineus]|uniref:Uncharacterized protein n=1 Tax=Rhipicephalus sanguineus TaxID=34632 RepID=A0A9D4T3S1_RHISA|nr:hypothetical protein HPB52_013612 [Rhipicephalus sanguineus]
MLSRFLMGLTNPVRRFLLSYESKTFDEATEIAAKGQAGARLHCDQSASRSCQGKDIAVNDAVDESFHLHTLKNQDVKKSTV